MSEQQSGGLSPQDLDDILGPDDKELANLVEEMMIEATAESLAKKNKEAAKTLIIQRMDEMGLTGVTVAGRKLGFSTTMYYGIEHEDPEKRERFKKWMEEGAPTINLPASANVKKAVELWLDIHPDEELPDFIKVNERRSLTNRKA